ncbi:DUF3087 family protein [Psychrosphaera ytuae]|uniref:DUF3087 family protein n=1 Tax=Psychrosphaera ytuae TaxID=2820710 RepID=A0A975DD58_9GAMM|nr:DUF3087 family protein [Psychrosphaera ytuae]QTH64688.1 DUF3087 family protein [Psychrosphaera ytuae]
MKLESIDKSVYRSHLNRILWVSIVAFASMSLLISQVTIYLFTDREGTHFWLNVMGVVVSMIIIGSVFNRIKSHPYFYEVYYVWRLKQQINYIIRKNKALEQAVEQDDVQAITIMAFYYKACEQLYTLDDNTITMSALNKKSNALQEKIDALNQSIDISDYSVDMLKAY